MVSEKLVMDSEKVDAVYDVLVKHANADPAMKELFLRSWPECKVWNFSVAENRNVAFPFRVSWQAVITATGLPRTPALMQCNVAEELTEERADLIHGVNNALIDLFNPVELEEVLGRRVPAIEVAKVINKARIGRIGTKDAVHELVRLGLLIDLYGGM